MERLKVTYNPCDECRYSYSKQNQESNQCKVCEFKTYVDSERQGLIIVLPCKVGDTVFWVTKLGVIERYVSSMDLIRQNHVAIKLQPLGLDGEKYPFSTVKFSEEFGDTVFLTKEEAEAALARMVKENEWN